MGKLRSEGGRDVPARRCAMAKRDRDGRIGRWTVRRRVPIALLTALLGILSCVTSRAESPNVVFIISDDQTWTDFGFMGNERVHTPHLDALAARSAVFPHGYVPASVCRPSLVTMLTGLYPHQHGVHFNHGPPGNSGYNAMTSVEEYHDVREREFALIAKVPTLPGLLRDRRGYRSLQTGKFWEGHWRNGGFTEGMTTFGVPPSTQTFGGIRKLASGERVAHGNGDTGLQIGRETMEPIVSFIDDCEAEDTPWLIWYAPYLPHQPHDSPGKFYEIAAARPGVEEHELPYFASIAQFDATVGTLVEFVESRGLASETLFVFAVDNGWSPSTIPQRNRPVEFAHTKRSKRAPFDEGLRTPVLLRWDGRIEARKHEGLVSTVDLVPTILAAAGIEGRSGMPGIDLLPVAEGGDEIDPERAVFGAVYPGDATRLGHPEIDVAYRWVRKGAHKLIVPRDDEAWGGYLDEPVLFDVVRDPGEERDRIDDPAFSEVRSELESLLDAWWPGEALAADADPESEKE